MCVLHGNSFRLMRHDSWIPGWPPLGLDLDDSSGDWFVVFAMDSACGHHALGDQFQCATQSNKSKFAGCSVVYTPDLKTQKEIYGSGKVFRISFLVIQLFLTFWNSVFPDVDANQGISEGGKNPILPNKVSRIHPPKNPRVEFGFSKNCRPLFETWIWAM